VDGVVFASARPLEDLVAAGRVDAKTCRTLATNRLVLIGPKAEGSRANPPGASAASALTFATLASLPEHATLAIGDPGAVPAGQYARDYLQALGSWDALKGHLLLGGDVGAVLTYARRGEVAAAIVYATEARGLTDIVVLDEATGPDVPRPVVVAGTVGGAPDAKAAEAFFEFAAGDEGQRILREFGFRPP
jgi:molybdate transport system substrate-binding protein